MTKMPAAKSITIINKKILVIIVTIIFIIVAIISAIILTINNGKTSKSAIQATYTAIDACDLMTLDQAKTLLGDNTIISEHYGPETGNIISVSNCTYTNNETDLSALRVIHISARSALSKDGQDSNTTAFESTNGYIPAAGDEVVTGYGDKALWNTTVHELAILKGDLWIRVQYGGSDSSTYTLGDAKKAADLVLTQ